MTISQIYNSLCYHILLAEKKKYAKKVLKTVINSSSILPFTSIPFIFYLFILAPALTQASFESTYTNVDL